MENLAQTGGFFILPSTFSSGPQHMYQMLQDSLAICHFCLKPDLFLTMTANGSWPEITENLLPGKKFKFDVSFISDNSYIGQSAVDHPDLVARIFYQKQQALLKKVRAGYYGKVAGLVYTIEYQKRGLPHMHLLIFLEAEYKIRTVEQVDAFISTQIPDRNVHLQLYQAVEKFVLHGPCTPERCLENGQCKKRFPKSFCPQTLLKDDGYPEYARPDNGRTIQKNNTIFTNKDVIPHPPELLVEFNCHINLEVCASIKSVKYIHKYIYKGNDRTTLEMSGADEIKLYLDSRYISSTEAAWCIFEFAMHLEWPSVIRLPVHLPNEQMVFYDPEDNTQDVLERAAARDTCLTGWFKANANEDLVAAGAHDYLYQIFPQNLCGSRTGPPGRFASVEWLSEGCILRLSLSRLCPSRRHCLSCHTDFATSTWL